jgi:hypothetical protein
VKLDKVEVRVISPSGIIYNETFNVDGKTFANTAKVTVNESGTYIAIVKAYDWKGLMNATFKEFYAKIVNSTTINGTAEKKLTKDVAVNVSGNVTITVEEAPSCKAFDLSKPPVDKIEKVVNVTGTAENVSSVLIRVKCDIANPEVWMWNKTNWINITENCTFEGNEVVINMTAVAESLGVNLSDLLSDPIIAIASEDNTPPKVTVYYPEYVYVGHQAEFKLTSDESLDNATLIIGGKSIKFTPTSADKKNWIATWTAPSINNDNQTFSFEVKVNDTAGNFNNVTGQIEVYNLPKLSMNVEAPSSVYVGDTIEIKATIGNSRGIAVNISVELIYNGKVVDSTTINKLNNGSSKLVTLRYKPQSTGAHLFTVKATPEVGTPISKTVSVGVQSKPTYYGGGGGGGGLGAGGGGYVIYQTPKPTATVTATVTTTATPTQTITTQISTTETTPTITQIPTETTVTTVVTTTAKKPIPGFTTILTVIALSLAILTIKRKIR